jgi:hypothetical protein
LSTMSPLLLQPARATPIVSVMARRNGMVMAGSVPIIDVSRRPSGARGEALEAAG